MRFLLRCRRDIPTDKKGNVPIKQVLRGQFSTQLQMLWETTPELKGIKANGLPVGWINSKGIVLDPEHKARKFYGGTITKDNKELTFIPLVTYASGWECELAVRFLIRQDKISTLDPEIGDADKRIRILLGGHLKTGH